MPRGTADADDTDWQATLHRNVLEEAGVTLRDVVPFGYQEVRMAGHRRSLSCGSLRS